MTTSPRFFAATLTVLAETRFVDVRACIIFAFRKFRVRVCRFEGSVARPSARACGSGGRGPNRRIANRRFYPEERETERAWIRIFRVGIGYV